MQNLPEIDNLIKLISKLPGLGPKSAKRIILKMINNRQEILKPLANNLSDVFKNIERCKICGTLKSNSNPCNNCEDKNKKYSKICVVENISDQWAIESSSIFQGYYHILGGTLSENANGNNRENLLINSLVERIKNDNIDEVILATSATIEGQTTAFYIQDSLKNTNVKISKLAQGLPVGGEIETSDDGTLISAFKNRRDL
ncbi:recombinase RecR [Pelagibacteraceae bacterium GOM-A5]|nr:recombinase RecR [Pelagibacteraceae bacterium GOM-A5]